MEQLKKRVTALQVSVPFVDQGEEDLEHFLILCPMVWGLWAALVSIPGAGWV